MRQSDWDSRRLPFHCVVLVQEKEKDTSKEMVVYLIDASPKMFDLVGNDVRSIIFLLHCRLIPFFFNYYLKVTVFFLKFHLSFNTVNAIV